MRAGRAAVLLLALVVLLAGACGGTRKPPVLKTRGGDVWAWSVRVGGTADCESVDVTGGRAPVDAKVAASGRYTAHVPLREGSNRVTAACTAGGPASEPVRFRVRLRERPRAMVRASVRTGRVVLDGSQSEPGEPHRAKIAGYRWSQRRTNPARLRLAGERATASAPVPKQDGEYYVTLRVTDTRGRTDESTVRLVVADGRATVPPVPKSTADWIERAVLYGVIPGRFGEHGAASVQSRLDDLKQLGVDAIWLSPVNKTPEGDFGYAVTDYFGLRPDFGTKAQFKELVRAAHARGIRVLMDFVPNHTSDRHPYFRDTKKHGRASRYWSFYDRDAFGLATNYFDWTNLPNLNYDNPEVRAMITAAFEYWVREFDVDGFRIDATWGVQERRPSFWPSFTKELKRIKPDLLLLSEASARDPYWFRTGFDAAYDWTDQLGQWAWEGVFDDPKTTADDLNHALTNPPDGYAANARILRFLNNNDTGLRFVTQHGVPTTRVAAAALLTLPGLPLVYTGDEVGAEFEPYREDGPISWRDRDGLRPWYRKLIALRHDIPSLHADGFAPDDSNAARGIYAYVRYGGSDGRPVLVVLNFSDRAVRAQVRVPARFDELAGTLEDVLNDEQVSGTTVPMPPHGARILVPH